MMDTEKKIPKRLAVDFDNTLFHVVDFPYRYKVTWMNKLVHMYVKYMKKKGWYIILNTCRELDKGLDYAMQVCQFYGIPIDAYNEQEPTAVSVWGEARKIACDRSIDDTQVGVIGYLLRRFA
jgi:hypothetical protein